MTLQTTRVAERALGHRLVTVERERDDRTTGWHLLVTVANEIERDDWFITRREAMAAFEAES
jgi:hypothetical protein